MVLNKVGTSLRLLEEVVEDLRCLQSGTGEGYDYREPVLG